MKIKYKRKINKRCDSIVYSDWDGGYVLFPRKPRPPKLKEYQNTASSIRCQKYVNNYNFIWAENIKNKC